MSDVVPEGAPVQKHKWGGALFIVPLIEKNMIKGASYGFVWHEKRPWGVVSAEKQEAETRTLCNAPHAGAKVSSTFH